MLKINKFFKKIPLVIFVFLFVFLYRLPNIGLDLINNDDGWWKSRGYEFSSAISNLEFEKTAPTYHPGVTLLWSQFVAIKAYGVMEDIGYTPEYFGVSEYILNHILQNIFVVLTTSLLLSLLYIGLSKIMGKFYAVFFIIVLASEPFFTALARTIHLDALLAISMFTSFVYYYLAIQNLAKEARASRIYMLIAGVIGGFALLTKSPALFLFPMFLVPLIFYKKDNFELKSAFLLYLQTFSVMILTVFIFWPAMWVDPVGSVKYILDGIKGVGIEDGHVHYWFGKEVSDPGWLFYPLVIIGRYSSVLFISFILGIFFLFTKNVWNRNKFYSFYLESFIFFLAYLLMLSLASKKIDRYSLLAVFPMITLSIYFVINLNLKRLILKIILSCYIFSALVIYAGLYSYYLVYYSPLIGGYDYGMKILEPSWQVAYAEVAKYLNNKKGSENLKVALLDHFYIRGYANFETFDLSNEDRLLEADYIVIPKYREGFGLFYESKLNIDSDKVVEVAGIQIYEIYRVEKAE